MSKSSPRRLLASALTRLSPRALLRGVIERVKDVRGPVEASPSVAPPPASPMPTREQALADMRARPIVLGAPRSPGAAEGAPPRVSIVIPVHGKIEFTWACLRSIAEHCSGVDHEVVVVDDASPDETPSLAGAAAGLRLLRNETNLGFIGACNRGAAEARGEYVVFLNNDTRVRPQWLEWMLRTFEAAPGVGLVGSQLIFPDGTMQESGSIVFRDGRAWNYGRRGDPDDDRHRYLRDVDYCSGASIMLPRALFERLGGFDPLFSPAYYEDTDLAFRVRREGLRTVVQPLSRLTHYEGITAGTDVSAGTKRYQVLNHEKFFARWRDVLASAGEFGVDVERQKERAVRRRALLVDAMPHAGGAPLADLVRLPARLRAAGAKLTVFPTGALDDACANALRAAGIEVLTPRFAGTLEAHLAREDVAYDVVLVDRDEVASSAIAPAIEALRARRPATRVELGTFTTAALAAALLG
jgi:GT2 family glycosyltransferase